MSPHRSGSKPDRDAERRLDQANRARATRRRRRPTGEREPWRDRRTPTQRQADRSVALLRIGLRHKAGILGWLGIFSALTCMWAFTGVTQIVATGASLGAAGAGAAIRHHERNKLYNSATTHTASRREVREHHEAMLRSGQRPRPETSGDTVRVKSHTNAGHGVKSHTRKKAGTSGNGTASKQATANKPAAKAAPKSASKPAAKGSAKTPKSSSKASP